MNKNIILMAAAAIALASCSNEEVVEVYNGNVIDFRASMGTGINTRGLETNNSTLSQFNVTAISNGALYFQDALFSSVGQGKFDSAVKYFWPGDGSPVEFYAYSYNSGKTGETLNALASSKYGTVTINPADNGDKKIEFTVQDDVDDQVDLVTAFATGDGTDNISGQSLAFGHVLSQIRIKAKNENTNYEYKVVGVKIGNVKNTGTYNFKVGEGSTDSWASISGSQTYEVTYDNAIELGQTAADIMKIADGSTGLMTVPQTLTRWDAKTNTTGSYIAVKVKITMVGTGTQIYPTAVDTYAYVYVPVPKDTSWEMGKCYTYTLDFSNGAGTTEEGTPILGSAIEFSDISVTAWENVANKDVNM